MMKKILVPSDLSDISENALKMAVDLAEKTDGEIYLINFTDHPAGESFTATGEINKKYANEENIYTVSLIHRYQKQLSQLAAKYSSESVQIHYQVYDETLKTGIIEAIAKNSIDLVVIGTSGEESADEFFSGNNTQQVIEVATCPVISIKNTFKGPDYSTIVLGLNFEKDRHDNFLRAARYLNDFAGSLNAKIDVVHIIEPGTTSQEKMEQELYNLIAQCKLNARTVRIIENTNKEEGLLNFARQRSASLLAVLTHADDSFFRVFRSSLSEDLSMSSDLPVMTINLHNI